ncbi:hypothetical protein ACFYRD_38565 [Streptomyces hirsutus]|uniref:hypothetical protein n=1 Tax=Streptomyces hirsutus TaxID=35620 RepID=UPI00369B86D3
MRIMLDNNIWSYLGDERSGKRFKAIAHSLGHRVVTAPSILLEVLQHPLADKRVAIVEAITTATDERLRSEADREGAEVVAEVRRLHPEWNALDARHGARGDVAHLLDEEVLAGCGGAPRPLPQNGTGTAHRARCAVSRGQPEGTA